MSVVIASVRGREILDSRGRPTVEVIVELTDGTGAIASVPAGMSRGTHEAVELRDGDRTRYRSFGVRKAVANVNTTIAAALAGQSALDQAAIDALLVELDGTPTKSHLGANAILAVSIATARAGAKASGLPLWRYLGGADACVLPVPMVNIVSGGLHAGGNVDFQDYLIIPIGAQSYSHALEMAVEVYATTAEILRQRGLTTLKADEGGFGPQLQSNAAALELLMDALEQAGYAPGRDIAFAIDVAASHFYDVGSGLYHLASEGRICTSDEMVHLLASLVEAYPIISIEDGLSEDDWEGWQQLTAQLGPSTQLMGDDLFATNVDRLDRGISSGSGNAILVKMNQIGTLTETIAVVRRAKSAGFRTVISARSGETEDSALADLAVATNAGQIKIGSVAQSERLAKYNQLLRIEEGLGRHALFDASAPLRAGAVTLPEPLV